MDHRLSGLRVLVASLAAALGAPAGAQALPILSEVLYDAVGCDDGAVFVELYGAPGESLDGLYIDGVNGSGGAVTVTIALSGVIPEDGFFVLADVTGAGTSSLPVADQLANFDFQNGPDSLVLRSETTVLDALGYGSFGPGDVFAGEGAPAADVPAGSSLARRFADVDTGDNGADFFVSNTPTPGTGPVLGVPEPAAALLVVSGLFAVWPARRRG